MEQTHKTIRAGKTKAWYRYIAQMVKAGETVKIMCPSDKRAREVVEEVKALLGRHKTTINVLGGIAVIKLED